MIVLKNKKRHKIKLFRMIMIITFGFISFNLINQQIKINNKKKTLEELQEQIRIQEIKNNNLYEIIEDNNQSSSNNVEKIAREQLDFAKQEERVFVNIS